MSSSRLRPRLRLGPVDGHDEDFDPLLGRTARDTAATLPPLASAGARAAPPPAAQASVFDEPDQAGPDGELPPVPAPPAQEPAATVATVATVATITWQPITGEIPVRRLPSQPPGSGLFVFRNPWRGSSPADGTAGTGPGLLTVPRQRQARVSDLEAQRTEPAEPDMFDQPDPPRTPLRQAAEDSAVAADSPAGPDLPSAPAEVVTAAGSQTEVPATLPPDEADSAPALLAPQAAPEAVREAAPDVTPALPEAPETAAAPTAALEAQPAPSPAPSLAPATPDPEPVPAQRWPFGVGQPGASALKTAPQPEAPEPALPEPALPETATREPETPETALAAPDQLLLPIEPAAAGPAAAVPLPIPTGVTDDAAAAVARPSRPDRAERPRQGKASPRSGQGRAAPGRRKSRAAGQRSSRAPAARAPIWTVFAASFLAGSAALMTGAALAAPLGGMFQRFSDHLMYLMILPLVALGLWVAARQIVPALLTLLVLLVQGVIVVPSLGIGPRGGDTRTIVGWAPLSGSQDALVAALREAERQEARLLLLGDAPESVLSAPPAGWIVAARPSPGDGAAITILSRGGWRAANVAGEPAMARTEDGSVTVIGVNPPITGGDTRARDAEINRSATRAGMQTTATLAIGTFGVVPWNGAIGQFTSYGDVTRVRCGGLFGATRGLLPVDHAFVRQIAVTGCRVTSPLPGSGHRPIWIRLGAPETTSGEGSGR